MNVAALIATTFLALTGVEERGERAMYTRYLDVGAFGAPMVQVAVIDAEVGLFTGGQAGIVLNHRLTLGGAGMTTQTPNGLRMNCAGFLVEYSMTPDEPVHASVVTLVGAGSLERDGELDAIYFIDFGVNVEFTLTDWMRLAVGPRYRFVDAVRMLDPAQLEGITGSVVLKFGSF